MTTHLVMVLYNFNIDSGITDWKVVDDAIMGGHSNGHFHRNDEGHAVYSGQVSLQNNGGFSSVKHTFSQRKILGYTTAYLRLKGDGKRYQFRIKSDQNHRHTYIHYFETTGEWQTIEIPLKDMKPTFRGRDLNMPNYPVKVVEVIAFLIANKKTESFRLEIDRIELH